MKKRLVVGILLIGTLYFLLPLLSNPNTFLYRNNDLEEFFWPLIEYVKQSITNSSAIPLWNSMWFGGQPLIADPQTPSVYLPNIIFLFFPIYTSFIISISFHIFLASLFFYLFLKTVGNNNLASVTGALLYISTPRLAASIEAGHFGLITAWTWIACILYLVSVMRLRPQPKLSVYLAIAIMFLLQSHIITAIIVLPIILLVGLVTTSKKKHFILLNFISVMLAACFLAPSLIPQLLWQKITTRSLLLERPETYPLWISKFESLTYFFQEMRLFIPKGIETEKTIGVGSFVLLLSALSVIKIKKIVFALLIIVFVLLFSLVLNNSSPLYELILATPFLNLMRVTTRVWVLVLITLIIYAVRTLSSVQKKRVAFLLSGAALINSYFLGWQVLAKPYGQSTQVSNAVYIYIQTHPNGKVWCISHCINQRSAVEHNIELIDGYATIQQLNYYQASWGLFGGYWNYYSLAVPPFGIESSQTLKPDYELLGRYNVGYIVSKNVLTSTDLNLDKIIDGYYIYINTRKYPQQYFIKANHKAFDIEVKASTSLQFEPTDYERELIVSTPYSPGWVAHAPDQVRINANESPDRLLVFTVPANITNITIEYEPPGHRYGLILFIFGSIFAILLLRFQPRMTGAATS